MIAIIYRDVARFAIAFFCMVVFLFSPSVFSKALTVSDLNSMSDSVLEEEIAKMFVVGVPADYSNISRNKRLDYIVNVIKVGGIKVNNYNVPISELSKYEDRETAFSAMSPLFVYLEGRGHKDKPILFVDFESGRYASVKYPLFSPPSALTLASTGNTEYAFYTGRLAAYQLNRIGVDVVLGPVLDIDNSSKQGRLSSTMTNRSFSDSIDVSSLFSKRYMQGLHSLGVKSFAKHYPPYSSITSNPHTSEVVYTGSDDFLKRDLRVFTENKDNYDGIMTSHLSLGTRGGNVPFTLSSKLMDRFSEGDLAYIKGKLIITDDLSDMKAVHQYVRSNKKDAALDYTELSLLSFKAGHDLLLYSHIEEHSKSGFKISDLERSIGRIREYVRDNKKAGFQIISATLMVERREVANY